MRVLGMHTLLHPIVLATRDATTGDEKEETLKPAGFSVTMRRPKGKDLRIVDRFGDQEVAATLAMISALSNLDDVEVENLDSADVSALGNLLAEAMPSGGPTGETVSAT